MSAAQVLRIVAGEAPRPGEVLLARRLPSRVDLKQELIDAIDGILVGRGLVAPDDHSWLCICLDEAVVNAMLHGNEGDPGLEIAVELRLEAGRWVLLVDDQGEGFTPDCVPDPADPESLLLEHGRGIRIMLDWLDELTYYRNGATAFLARRRSDLPG